MSVAKSWDTSTRWIQVFTSFASIIHCSFLNSNNWTASLTWETRKLRSDGVTQISSMELYTSPSFSSHASQLFKYCPPCFTVSESPITHLINVDSVLQSLTELLLTSCLLALVIATFNLLLSARKPTSRFRQLSIEISTGILSDAIHLLVTSNQTQNHNLLLSALHSIHGSNFNGRIVGSQQRWQQLHLCLVSVKHLMYQQCDS